MEGTAVPAGSGRALPVVTILSEGACAVSASPFTAEELELLDLLRATKAEWRRVAARPGAGSAAGHEARLDTLRREDARLRVCLADARRRRMIALGHESGEA